MIEKEPRLVAFLRYHFGDRMTVVEGDALVEPIPAVRAIVGNLPFSIATTLLMRWFEGSVPRVVALVQKEVGERLAAGPGSKTYGRISILAALLRHHRVPPERSGRPRSTPTRVDGRLITFDRRRGPLPGAVPPATRIAPRHAVRQPSQATRQPAPASAGPASRLTARDRARPSRGVADGVGATPSRIAGARRVLPLRPSARGAPTDSLGIPLERHL